MFKMQSSAVLAAISLSKRVLKPPKRGLKMRSLLALLSVAAYATVLAGCGMTTVSAVQPNVKAATPFCSAAEPFLWDKDDTDETIVQAKEHNAVGKVLGCPKFTTTGGVK